MERGKWLHNSVIVPILNTRRVSSVGSVQWVKTYSTGFLNVKALKITFDQHHAEKEKKKERKGILL